MRAMKRRRITRNMILRANLKGMKKHVDQGEVEGEGDTDNVVDVPTTNHE
jgi:hypothetical protein